MRKSTRTEISFRCKQQPGVIFSAVQRSVHAIDNLNILVSKTQRSSLRTPWKLIDGKSRKIEVINRNSQVSIYHQLMMVIKKRLSASLIGCSGWWQEMVPRVRVHSFLSSTRSHPTWRPLNYLGRHFSDIYNAEIFTNIWEAYRLVY